MTRATIASGIRLLEPRLGATQLIQGRQDGGQEPLLAVSWHVYCKNSREVRDVLRAPASPPPRAADSTRAMPSHKSLHLFTNSVDSMRLQWARCSPCGLRIAWRAAPPTCEAQEIMSWLTWRYAPTCRARSAAYEEWYPSPSMEGRMLSTPTRPSL